MVFCYGWAKVIKIVALEKRQRPHKPPFINRGLNFKPQFFGFGPHFLNGCLWLVLEYKEESFIE
jgi:hypothetical protein